MDELPMVPVACPYCGETIELLVDVTAGAQRYVEDCRVCCRPMDVHLVIEASGEPMVEVRTEDD